MIRPDFQRATTISLAAHIAVFLASLIIISLRAPQNNKVYTISLVSPSGDSKPAIKRAPPPKAKAKRQTTPPAKKRTPPHKKRAVVPAKKRTPPASKSPAMAVKDAAPSAMEQKETAIEKLRREKQAREARTHMNETIKALEEKKRLEEVRAKMAAQGAQGAGQQHSRGERNEIMEGYSNRIMQKIKANWVFPEVNMAMRAEVSITVFADGTIRINRMTIPSASQAFNQSVLKAIIKTKKVDPPPFGTNEDVKLNFIPVKG